MKDGSPIPIRGTAEAMRWLIHKEWLLFFSDPSGALITILMPALLALLLGSIFQPPTDGGRTRVALVESGSTPASPSWRSALENRPELEIIPLEKEEAISQVSRGLLLAAILLPEDVSEHFRGERLANGKVPSIGFLSDPSRELEASRVRGVLRAVSADLLAQSFQSGETLPLLLLGLGERLDSLPLPPGMREPIASSLEGLSVALQPLLNHPIAKAVPPIQASEMTLRFDNVPIPSEHENVRTGYHSYSHAFSGMICMFLLFFGLERAKEHLDERQRGMQFRIRTTPTQGIQLLLGPWIATASIAFLSALCTFALGWLVVDVTVHGSFVGFLVLLLALSWFVGGFTTLLAQVSRSQQVLTALGTLLILLFSFLGGAWAPSFVLSETLQSIGQFLPTTWATQGLAAVTWRGMGIEEIWLPAGILVAAGTAFGCAGYLMGERQE